MMTSLLRTLAVCGVAVGVLAGSADAQRDRDFDHRSEQVMVMVQDGDQYKLHIVDGELDRVEVNGLEIDEDLVEEEGGVYRIFDEAGDVVAELPAGAPVGIRTGAIMAPPKTMMGIRHGEVDEQLREFLGLEPGEARVVVEVRPGLPADKAGLRPFDVIVEVEGRRPVTPELFTKLLRAKNPGDELHMWVIRKGDKREVVIELEPFRGELLEQVQGQRRQMELDIEREFDAQRLAKEALQQAEEMRRFAFRFGDDFEGEFPGILIEREDFGDDMEEMLEEVFEEIFEEVMEDAIEEQEEQLDERFERLYEHLEEVNERLEEVLDRLELDERR